MRTTGSFFAKLGYCKTGVFFSKIWIVGKTKFKRNRGQVIVNPIKQLPRVRITWCGIFISFGMDKQTKTPKVQERVIVQMRI